MKYASDKFQSLVDGLLEKDPEERLGKDIDLLKSHPFFQVRIFTQVIAH